MKPKNIILIRHGQSEGNINKNLYQNTPDYTFRLTPMGREQAHTAGEKLRTLLGGGTSIQFYVSPFWRTRETYQEIVKSFPFSSYYEDPRLREQEWGHYRDPENTNIIEAERENYGHFYYRFPDGESCADTYDRVSDFLNTLHRDFEKEHYSTNVIIVSHGMTIRLFLMRFFHWTVEQFEELANPRNCEYFRLKLNNDKKYDLVTPLRKHVVKHSYQFKWDEENILP